MTRKTSLFAIGGAVGVCAITVWVSTLIGGGEITYEVRPEITIPEYKTDAARAIDAYERMMDRYMHMAEMNSVGLNMDIRILMEKLDSLDRKMDGLSVRMARIEKALGIEKPKKASEEKPRPGTSDKPTGEGGKPPAR
jgi:hypothetical protein